MGPAEIGEGRGDGAWRQRSGRRGPPGLADIGEKRATGPGRIRGEEGLRLPGRRGASRHACLLGVEGRRGTAGSRGMGGEGRRGRPGSRGMLGLCLIYI
jgi:hypothetical protein